MDCSTFSAARNSASFRLARQSKLDTISEESSRMSVATISSYYEGSLGWDSSDDLYDVSDSESERADAVTSIPSPRHWPTAHGFKTHAVPVTAAPQITLSSALLSKLPSQAASSATPSLDGSLTSDQQACMSVPSTPDCTENPADRVNWDAVSPMIEVGIHCADLHDGSVQLPAEAMDLLQVLSQEHEAPIELEAASVMGEMQEVARAVPAPEAEPVSASSEYSLSALSVPSPTCFFSSLDANSRATWSTQTTNDVAPPSSTTAEHFYNAPWNRASHITEQTVETVGDGETTVGPTTARFAPTTSSVTSSPVTSELQGFVGLTELQQASESVLCRTSQWAAQQSEVLHELAGKDVPTAPAQEAIVGKCKRAVKFLDTEKANAAVKEEGDPLFYHTFQTLSNQSSPTDSFVHRHSRFDAMQALRSTLRESHIDSLLGNFSTTEAPARSSEPRPISSMAGTDSNTTDAEAEAAKEAIAQLERERQAYEQVAPSMWIMEGLRFLAGGRLLNSPAHDVLARAPSTAATRVLDLGGQPQCDWAWACAREFPHVRTYTATSDTRAVNLSVRGPRNHRVVRVAKLYQLPFPDNHFDLISARSLHQFLRAQSADTDEWDACLKECYRVLKPGGFLEYFLLDAELVQAGPRGEAASVEFAVNLKRYGYDAAPTRSFLRRARTAGFTGMKRAWMFLPLGAIQTPDCPMPETPPPPALDDVVVPTHGSGRVSALSTSTTSTAASSASSSPSFSTVSSSTSASSAPVTLEAVRGPVGTAADAAHVSGLVGSCLWERWMLKLQMEMGREQKCLLDGVGAVVEEGRRTGAGWRSLSGWARKPLASLQTTF